MKSGMFDRDGKEIVSGDRICANLEFRSYYCAGMGSSPSCIKEIKVCDGIVKYEAEKGGFVFHFISPYDHSKAMWRRFTQKMASNCYVITRGLMV